MNDTASISKQSAPRSGDPALLARFVQQHDQNAFGHLVERYESVVMGAAFRRTGNLEMARDVTQQVFVTLARKAAGLLQHPQLGGWLYRTASFQAARLKRSEIRRRRRESKFAIEGESGSTEGEPPEMWEPLEVALAKLNSKNRELIVMHYFQDLAYAEMAADLGISEVATRKRVSRALADLGERLRRADCTSITTKLLAGAAAAQAILSPSATLAANALAAPSAAPSSIFSILATMTTAKTTTAAPALVITLGLLIVLQVGLAVSQATKQSSAMTTGANDAPDESIPTPALGSASDELVPAGRQLRLSLPGPGGTRVPRAIAMRTAQKTHALFDGREIYRDMIKALQLTPVEVEKINEALTSGFAQIEEIESSTLEIGTDKNGLRTWDVPPYPEDNQRIMEEFEAILVELLGQDRSDYAMMSFAHSFYFADRGKNGVRLSFLPKQDPALRIFTGVRGTEFRLSIFGIDRQVGSRPSVALEREFGHLIDDIDEVRRTLESIKTKP